MERATKTQNSLNKRVQGLDHKLELSQNLFLGDNVVKNGVLDNLSLQKNLLATGLLKDNILDSLDMIVSSDGKLSNASVRRQLDKKFPSVMRKPNPIGAVFKDKARFGTQNPIIDTLLTQIESDELNKRNKLKNN